jgi:hypothetical protein
VPRLRCARCGVSHALLPAFTLAWRLDVAETIGSVVGEVVAGGVRGPPGGGAGGGAVYDRPRLGPPVPGPRREAGGGVRGVAVELGGQAVTPPAGAGRFALTAIDAAFAAAASLPGWGRLGAWRFASAVTGGRLIAANTVSPWYVIGRRRLMPPIPP